MRKIEDIAQENSDNKRELRRLRKRIKALEAQLEESNERVKILLDENLGMELQIEEPIAEFEGEVEEQGDSVPYLTNGDMSYLLAFNKHGREIVNNKYKVKIYEVKEDE